MMSDCNEKFKNTEYLKNVFLEHCDEKYKSFHASLVPELNSFYGVRIPDLRKIAKEISKENAVDFLENYPISKESFYEEKVVFGLVCATAKIDDDKRKAYLKKFIPLIDNWAVCDVVVSSMKFLKKNADKWKDFIFYYADKREFEKRFFIVSTMSYYANDMYIDEILHIYVENNDENYYVNMAVAWSLATIYLKYPQKVLDIVENSKLNKFTTLKTISKLCESYRVDESDKVYLKSLREKMKSQFVE